LALDKSQLKSSLNIEIASFMRTKHSWRRTGSALASSRRKLVSVQTVYLPTSFLCIVIMADIPRAEASPRLPFKTFRIEQIDSNTTEEDMHQELSGAGIHPVTHLSLASVPNGKSKTATVTIRVDERAVATEYTNVAGVHRRLDTDMFGFTPLSDAVGHRDYVESVLDANNGSYHAANEGQTALLRSPASQARPSCPGSIRMERCG
jgi:hypothetical protein